MNHVTYSLIYVTPFYPKIYTFATYKFILRLEEKNKKNTMKKNFIFLVALGATTVLLPFSKAGTGSLKAQSLVSDMIASSGTFATFPSGSMSWTIGEVMTESYSSAGNVFTQGFLQPEVNSGMGVSNLQTGNISIYPNPVVDNLTIDFSGISGNQLIYIYDMHGHMLLNDNIPAGQEQFKISFREFANGIYLLNIINSESNTLSAYKINKTE